MSTSITNDDNAGRPNWGVVGIAIPVVGNVLHAIREIAQVMPFDFPYARTCLYLTAVAVDGCTTIQTNDKGDQFLVWSTEGYNMKIRSWFESLIPFFKALFEAGVVDVNNKQSEIMIECMDDVVTTRYIVTRDALMSRGVPEKRLTSSVIPRTERAARMYSDLVKPVQWVASSPRILFYGIDDTSSGN